jgi:hypothetical protein
MEAQLDAFAYADDRTVYVREYLRLKNGRWETVKAHFRRPRRANGAGLES